MVDLRGAGLALTQAGLSNACQRVGVNAAEIWAVIFTETDTPYGGFWADRRPQILYEQHVFHRLTNGTFDQSHPDISSPNGGNYGASGAHQYDRLGEAMALNESAALQSASWGIGQTLGENYKTAGFATPQDMVQQMILSEDEQLLAAVREILAGHIDTALATHDWKQFARVYNGPGYAANNYDEVLRGWYEKFASGALPDLHIRTAQLYLMYLGFAPGLVDGVWGKRTRAAMNQFQSARGIPQTDRLDDLTFERIVNEAQAAA